VTVRLEDHFTGREINAALARGEGFGGAFPGETDNDDLGALRDQFRRKALLARQGRLCEALLAEGATPDEVAGRPVADLPDLPDSRRCLELRAQLGIPSRADSPAFVQASGAPFAAAELSRWLQMARLVRTGLEANGEICRSLLAIRHQQKPTPVEV
jgi:hypothetical protein